MADYCTREDVLRELGGDERQLRERFDARKWSEEPTTTVSVDGLSFDVPTSILNRIDKQIEFASSRMNTAILNAYKATPTVVPPHLTLATAQLAATRSVTTDGQRPDYLREMETDVKEYFGKIAKWELDLGIVAPRPSHRKPAAFVARGVGSRGASALGAYINSGCDPFPRGPCDC